MAGDWIKVEHATLHKPEVTLAAEYLGISRRETLGILLDYWAWLDANARHAVVTHVSRKSLEAVLQCVGLSAVLELIGWVKFDDERHEMTITNYDRHNGESAKTRALGRNRKVTQRSRISHDESVTREEKRREEIKPKTKAPALTRCPTDFGISERVKSWAVEKGHKTLPAHFDVFMSYVKRKAPRYADWDEALMTCVRENWGDIGGASVPGATAAWWTSEPATLAKGKEVGVAPRGGESMADYRGRITEAVQARVA